MVSKKTHADHSKQARITDQTANDRPYQIICKIFGMQGWYMLCVRTES